MIPLPVLPSVYLKHTQDAMTTMQDDSFHPVAMKPTYEPDKQPQQWASKLRNIHSISVKNIKEQAMALKGGDMGRGSGKKTNQMEKLVYNTVDLLQNVQDS